MRCRRGLAWWRRRGRRMFSGREQRGIERGPESCGWRRPKEHELESREKSYDIFEPRPRVELTDISILNLYGYMSHKLVVKAVYKYTCSDKHSAHRCYRVSTDLFPSLIDRSSSSISSYPYPPIDMWLSAVSACVRAVLYGASPRSVVIRPVAESVVVGSAAISVGARRCRFSMSRHIIVTETLRRK